MPPYILLHIGVHRERARAIAAIARSASETQGPPVAPPGAPIPCPNSLLQDRLYGYNCITSFLAKMEQIARFRPKTALLGQMAEWRPY